MGEGRGVLIGKVEEEHLCLVMMYNQICERFLVLGTALRAFHADTSVSACSGL